MGESQQEEDSDEDVPKRAVPKRAVSRKEEKPVHEVDYGRLTQILEEYQITVAEANDLVILDDYEMVVIADDSGSMASSALPPEERTLGAPKITRWDELKQTISLIIALGSCFDQNGLDVHFLNRGSVHGAVGVEQLQDFFAERPKGSTPLTETLRRVVSELEGEKDVLMFIMTDGIPDHGSEPFVKEVERIIKKKTTKMKIKFQIMACTADDEDVGWLNDLDKLFAEVDVTDDYWTERREVLAAGKRTQFTQGDWCMKAMLGPIKAKFDSMDEVGAQATKKEAKATKKVKPSAKNKAKSSACVVL